MLTVKKKKLKILCMVSLEALIENKIQKKNPNLKNVARNLICRQTNQLHQRRLEFLNIFPL